MTQQPPLHPIVLPPITHEEPLPAEAPATAAAAAAAPVPAAVVAPAAAAPAPEVTMLVQPVVAAPAAAAPAAVAPAVVATVVAAPQEAVVPVPPAEAVAAVAAAMPVTAAVVPLEAVHTPPLPTATPGMTLTHRPAGTPGVPGRRSLLPARWAGATAHCSLHWSGWLAVLPFAAITLLTATASAKARGMGTGAALGHVLATAVWGLTAAMAVAWVAWRVRGRTRTVATAAFIAALSLISIAGASGTVSRSASQAAAVKAARGRATAELTQAAHRADGAIDHAFDCLVADGGLSLRGVTGTAQIDRRLGLFDEVLKAVREKREVTEAVEGRLQVDLAAAELPAAQRESVLAAFHGEVQWEADRQILDATERVLAAGRDQLRFVRQEWGRVKVDRETGRCTFPDKKSADKLKQLSAQVMAANAVQRLAVKEAVANLHLAKPHELTPPQAAN